MRDSIKEQIYKFIKKRGSVDVWEVADNFPNVDRREVKQLMNDLVYPDKRVIWLGNTTGRRTGFYWIPNDDEIEKYKLWFKKPVDFMWRDVK